MHSFHCRRQRRRFHMFQTLTIFLVSLLLNCDPCRPSVSSIITVHAADEKEQQKGEVFEHHDEEEYYEESEEENEVVTEHMRLAQLGIDFLTLTTTTTTQSTATTTISQAKAPSRINGIGIKQQKQQQQKDNGQLDLSGDAVQAARNVVGLMQKNLENRLSNIFEKAKTPGCRSKIAQHFSYFTNALGREQNFPFHDIHFVNECPEPVYPDWNNLPENVTIGQVQQRMYQPTRGGEEKAMYIDDPNELRFCYAILTHDDPQSTIRLIDTLYEEGNNFVVHVDGKESSEHTYEKLVQYASTRDYVHILDHPQRVRVNWGGFSMVNATMQILRYVFALDDPQRKPLDFHKLFHVASTSYPLASRSEIRRTMASFPLDANFFHVIMKPTRPSPTIWHYFVECDDAIHRIHRLPPLQNATAGAELYTSSQWFTISREFALYLAEAKPGTFVHQFLEYVEHVVVADETFFGTVLRHTPFCLKHHNRNFLHLQFDRWESDLPQGYRDERKCIMQDPNHCGRSPTTMTVDYADILELSDDLFARKFVGSVDSRVKDIVDHWREKREEMLRDIPWDADLDEILGLPGIDFEGHGVLIVAKETVLDPVPLCLGIGNSGNILKLVPCFFEEVVPLLEEDWETGGVIIEETQPHNRWEVGPCTNDGFLERLPTAEMQSKPGNYSLTGRRCMLKQVDGARAGRCLDADSGKNQPGGETRVFPCLDRWYQFLSFGDGAIAPNRSMFTTIPSHITRQLGVLGHEQSQYMCLGVYGRGHADEKGWDDEDESDESDEIDRRRADVSGDHAIWPPLSEWIDQEVITTQCLNTGAVIEWLFVPYIDENLNAPIDKVTENIDEL